MADKEEKTDKPKWSILGWIKRRKSTRYSYRAPLQARCSSWGRFAEVFCGNISDAGIYVRSEEAAQPGEAVQISLTTPDGGELKLEGTVRHIHEHKSGKRFGFGVLLQKPEGTDLDRYNALVQQAAARSAVRPAPQTPVPTGPDAVRAAEPPGSSALISSSGASTYAIGGATVARESVFESSPGASSPGASSPGASSPGASSPGVSSHGVSSHGDDHAAEAAPPANDDIAAAALDAQASQPTLQAPAPPLEFATPPEPKPVVAIDFGTTRSSVAVVIDRQAKALKLPHGGFDMPSTVGFRQDGSVMLGKAARNMLESDPTNAVASPKRLLGRKFNERELEPYLAALAMSAVEGPAGEVVLQAQGQEMRVSAVCAHVVHLMRLVAARHLGEDVTRAVLTTPVSFDDERYEALAEAAKMAGLEEVEFVEEPAAAALANQSDDHFQGLVAVYDFGGGTFDFSVIDVTSGDPQVVTTAGDVWLGGDDFDEVLAGAAANAFWREHNIEIRHQVVQWQRLLFAAEKAKRKLSLEAKTVISVTEAALSSAGPIDLEFTVSQAEFSELAKPIIERSMDTCQQALELSDIKVSELNAIYLSGGTSYIPAVYRAVTEFFGMEPRSTVPPQRAVLIGAAVYAAQLEQARIGV